MAFAPWAAALAGFRLVRQRPLAVLAWTAVIFLGRLAGLLLTTAISGPYIPALDAAVNAKTINLQAVSAAYQNVAPGYLAGAALALPFFAAVIAAIFRAYLQPQDGRFLFLRLGRREAAILALILALNLLIMFGLFCGVALIATIAGLIAVADAAAGALAEALGLVALAGAAVWVMVRLSLAWPLSFQGARPTLLRGWKLTRGQGWPLLGAYVMAEGLMLLVGILLFAVCAGLAGAVLVASGGTLEQLPDSLSAASTVLEVFRPAPMLFSAFEALLLALTLSTLAGVAVSTYRTLAPPEPQA